MTAAEIKEALELTERCDEIETPKQARALAASLAETLRTTLAALLDTQAELVEAQALTRLTRPQLLVAFSALCQRGTWYVQRGQPMPPPIVVAIAAFEAALGVSLDPLPQGAPR